MSAEQPGLEFDHAVWRRDDFHLRTGHVAVGQGGVLAVLGANGSGKTTALRLAAGLARPDAGDVRVLGQSVARWSPRDRARSVAMVPQRPVVGAPFTVREVVELGRHSLARSPAQVQAALDAVGLAHRAEEPFHRLSVGQQQRVVLARALAQHSPGGVLLLDETLAPVDPPETHRLVQLVRDLARQGATVALATHDLGLAAAVADTVWYLAHGETAAFGPASEVLQPDRLAGLAGVPIATAVGSLGTLPVPDLTAMLHRTP